MKLTIEEKQQIYLDIKERYEQKQYKLSDALLLLQGRAVKQDYDLANTIYIACKKQDPSVKNEKLDKLSQDMKLLEVADKLNDETLVSMIDYHTVKVEMAKRILKDFPGEKVLVQNLDQWKKVKTAYDHLVDAADLLDDDASIIIKDLRNKIAFASDRLLLTTVGKSFMEEAADVNNVDAEINLGRMYLHGWGVVKNEGTARGFFEKAEAKGNVDAGAHLGEMYLFGWGGGKDCVKAKELLKKAVATGHAHAENRLGEMYLTNTLGVKRNYETAQVLFDRAAKQGNTNAENHLGEMYYNGWGVDRNYATAKKWFAKAANKGHANAENCLGEIFFKGLGVAQNHETARALFARAAKKGHHSAEAHLGEMYLLGWGGNKNHIMAKSLLEKAADKDNANAENRLGEMYCNGWSVNKDYERAKELFEKAAAKGDINAEINLGKMHLYGCEGIPKDYKKARRLFTSAANKSNLASADAFLAEMYLLGLGGVQSYLEAKELFEKAAKKGNANAESRLGDMYYHGWGVDRNYGTAKKWFEKAAEKGSAIAKDRLSKMGMQESPVQANGVAGTTACGLQQRLPSTGNSVQAPNRSLEQRNTHTHSSQLSQLPVVPGKRKATSLVSHNQENGPSATGAGSTPKKAKTPKSNGKRKATGHQMEASSSLSPEQPSEQRSGKKKTDIPFFSTPPLSSTHMVSESEVAGKGKRTKGKTPLSTLKLGNNRGDSVVTKTRIDTEDNSFPVFFESQQPFPRSK